MEKKLNPVLQGSEVPKVAFIALPLNTPIGTKILEWVPSESRRRQEELIEFVRASYFPDKPGRVGAILLAPSLEDAFSWSEDNDAIFKVEIESNERSVAWLGYGAPIGRSELKQEGDDAKLLILDYWTSGPDDIRVGGFCEFVMRDVAAYVVARIC